MLLFVLREVSGFAGEAAFARVLQVCAEIWCSGSGKVLWVIFDVSIIERAFHLHLASGVRCVEGEAVGHDCLDAKSEQ